MNTTDIPAAVNAFLAEIGIEYQAVYAGERDKNEWNSRVDAFYVTFRRVGAPDFSSEFFMGLGHRKPRKGAIKPNPPYNPRTILAEEWNKQNLVPVSPNAATVLYNLLQDGKAYDFSFLDWCDNCGYDPDSIKALNTYNACCLIGRQLIQFFKADELSRLNTLLEDF